MEKFRILSKYQETDDIFGETEDEFNTLKLNDLQLNEGNDPKFTSPIPPHSPIRSPKHQSRFQQEERKVRRESPSTRRSISEYSEETSASSFDELDIGNLTNLELNQRLNHRTVKASNENEVQERELFNKYRTKSHKHDMDRTLRLDDHFKFDNNYDTMKFDNNRLLNGIDEENEAFDEGFEEFNLKPQIKKSLPNFQAYHQLADPSIKPSHTRGPVKKFQSSVNLSSKVINKLDRIPSFSQNKLNEMLIKNENFKVTKQQLLQQYKEIDKQHQKTNKRILSMKKSMSIPGNYRSTKNGRMGLVQYTEIPETPNSKMKFNNETRVWEGNNHELMKFNQAKPNLIKFNEFKDKAQAQVQNNMRFDSKNLRWVNSEEKEEDVFKDVPDFEVNPQSRQISTLTTASEYENEFILSKSKISRFLNEEEKIKRRLDYWLDSSSEYTMDYFWEIRKLVMDSE